MNSSINRISGLASGMDTDSLVKKLIQAESAKLDKIKQNQQKLIWQSDGYRQWNTDIFSFRSNTLFNMKLSSAYGTYSTSSSNTDAVTATATSDALVGSHTIEVTQLADSAALKKSISFDTTKLLNDTANGVNDSSSFTITVTDGSNVTHNATISVNPAVDKIGDVISRINTALDGSNKSLGVQAIYDSTLQQFILKTKDTGKSTKITISTDYVGAGDLLTKLGIANGESDQGSNAAIKFDGVTTIDDTSPSPITKNDVTILGVNYTLKKQGTSTITVSRDIDTEVKNIKDFVSKYNEMIDKLNKAVSEPVYRDYQPLTEDQKSSLSEKQIEQWEAKAKSGLFHNDSILRDLAYSMRNHVVSTVDNGSKYNSLASVGIASSNYQDKGKLYVDETKLRAALQQDPDAVKNLFSQSPNNAKDGQKGIIVRLYDDFQNAFKKLTDKAGVTGNAQADQSVVGKLLQDYNKKIDLEEQRLVAKENAYYKQFTAMEKALSQYNSQSAWLNQQLTGGQA